MFKANFGELAKEVDKIAKGFATLAANADELVASSVVLLAERARFSASILTPRSDEEGDHIADFWTFSVKKENGSAVATVGNVNPRANAPLGEGSKMTLLHILEYGSGPHKIKAGPATPLIFFWERTGRVERFDSVNHPGTKPHAILELAKLAAEEQTPVASFIFERAIFSVLNRQKVDLANFGDDAFRSVQNLGIEGIL